MYPQVYCVSNGPRCAADIEPLDYPLAVNIDGIDTDREQISNFTAYQTFRDQTQDFFHAHRQEIFLIGP